MAQFSVFEIVRPFLWIGAFGFVLGFAGYMFVGRAGEETLYVQHAPATVQASTPASPPPIDLRAI